MTFFAIPTGSSTPALESHSASAALRCSSGTAAAAIVDRGSLAQAGLHTMPPCLLSLAANLPACSHADGEWGIATA